MNNQYPSQFPPQKQREPGKQSEMTPQPEVIKSEYIGSGKLMDKVAIITGGDSGIGRSIAVYFAREGADVVVVYNTQDEDANETKKLVENENRAALLIKGDIGSESFCQKVIEDTISEFGKIDILVNNAAEQHPKQSIEEITEDQLTKTFRTNIFSMFYLSKAVMRYFAEGGVIINTASVTAYRGSEHLLDYSSTKGAIVAFTRSLAQNVASSKIRVNAVAPGPIWTPLITSTFDEKKVESFGKDTALGRAGQPSEVAPAYVFLASDIDSSYITGQVIHPNGGEIVNT